MAGSIVTNVGLTKLSSASPLDQLNITELAVGDGNGGFPDLDSSMTELTNEVWRGTVSNPIRDPENENILIFEAYMPSSVGGFTIREQAIFDDEGEMIAIGHTSELVKPASGEDVGVTVTMRMHIALSSSEQVDLFYTDTTATHHNSLTNRDDADSHPASAISTESGLSVQEKLDQSVAVEVATTEELINAFDSSNLPTGSVVRTLGYYTGGDGGGADWIKTGDAGTASQNPGDLSDVKLNDASGFEWELITTSSESSIEIEVVKVGCIPDTGNDNYLELAACSNAINKKGGGLLVLPAGQVLTSEPVLLRNNMRIVGKGIFNSELKKTSTADNSTIFTKPEPTVFYDKISIENLTLSGNWDTKKREVSGGIVSARSIIEVQVICTKFIYGTGFGLNLNRCRKAIVDGCRFEYICRDMCAIWATPQTIVTNNHFNGNDDDAVSLNNEGEYGNLDGEPVKSSIVVSGNTFTDTGSIRVQQARSTIVTNNVLQRVKCGSGINIGAKNADEFRVSNPNYVLIKGNIITDIIDRSVSTNFSISPSVNFRIGIKLESYELIKSESDSVNPGEVDPLTGMVYKPYGGYYAHSGGSNGDSIRMTEGIYIKDNIVKRTLPAVTNYSDWGYGEMFTRFSSDTFASDGFTDPEIVDEYLECVSLRIEGPLKNAHISDNEFSGGGFSCVFPIISTASTSIRNMYWQNVTFKGNVFSDFSSTGVDLDSLFSDTNQEIYFYDNVFDGDPYIRNDGRSGTPKDGTWASSSSCQGIGAIRVSGITIRRNTFKNLSIPYNLSTSSEYTDVGGNVFQGEPADINPGSFSSLNKGLGYYPKEVCGTGVLRWVSSDPSQSSYGEAYPTTVEFVDSNNPPSVGFYFRGQFVRCRNTSVSGGESVFGYRRLTSGYSHTLGVDWEEVSVVA